MLSNRYFALLAVLLLSGCPTANSDSDPAAGGGAAGQQQGAKGGGGGGVPGAAGAGGAAGSAGSAGAAGAAGAAGTAASDPIEMPKLPNPDPPAPPPPPPGKPIAVGCAANSECASGYCVDGVCCNTSCDSQCFSCNQTGQIGYCAAQATGDDLNAATPCTGPRTCGALNTVVNASGCRLKDLQACKTDGDCGSLHCVTFYVDHDQDGYGDSSTTLKLCEEPNGVPPGGYVAVGGDCCDTDANAHPGQTQYFTKANACSSYDYNCDQAIEGISGFVTYPNEPVAQCGTSVHGSCTSCTNTISCH